MNGLILHCGADKVTRKDVYDVPTPEPTDSHFPIPHEALIETVRDKMADAGLKVASHVHSLTASGMRYFGLMEVKMDDDWDGEESDDYKLIIGLRNTHDRSFAAGFVGGSHVMVCDNLCFFGEIKIGRKHTRHIERDLPGLVDNAVGQLASARVSQDERIAWYKENELPDDALLHDLLIKALDDGIIAGSKIPKVLAQWREPEHEEFTANGMSYWRLHNAFTEILKPISLNDKATRTMKLNGLLDGSSGLLAHRAVAQPEVGVVDGANGERGAA